MKMKKLTTFALAAALAIGTFGISVPVNAAENSTDYTITIPATLTVAQSGWNATDGITAQVKSGDTFDTSKKLTVTAESTNSWALKSGQITIGYNLATATGTYSATAEVPVWEFSAADLNADGGKTNPMGIIVEDYSSKPAGTYQDTVTFTAKVEDAKPEYFNKLTKINDNSRDQVDKLKSLGRGYDSYNSSLTAAQAYALATYQAAIDGKAVYVIMSSQDHGYEIHYAVSTDASATEHTADLYDICNGSNRMYYIAQ